MDKENKGLAWLSVMVIMMKVKKVGDEVKDTLQGIG
jgi:hypothetical protein